VGVRPAMQPAMHAVEKPSLPQRVVEPEPTTSMQQQVQNTLKGNAQNTTQKKAFVSPDGTCYEDEAAYKKHMYNTVFSFRNQTGKTLERRPGELRGQSFDMDSLTDCEVRVMDHTAQVLADRLINCKVLVGPCSADVFLRDCKGCTFSVACKQLRMRNCHDCTVFLYSMTRPALEMSSRIMLAPFNAAYPRLTVQFRQAGLQTDQNQWDQVHDFSRSDPSVPKPHWTKLSDEKFEEWRIEISGMSSNFSNPVPRESNALWFTNSTPTSSKMKSGLSRTSSGGKQGGTLFSKKSMFTKK